MLAETETRPDNSALQLKLNGVHHSARPTWKLKETVEFYRDVLDLDLCHAICARGWGPEDHPDFIHFFFDSGQGSTIAFFYYLNTEKPADSVEPGSYVYNSVHTAWRVETREELVAWKDKLEGKGFEIMQVLHETIESIYVVDPNGYSVEIAWQTRDLTAHDSTDADLTLKAAIAIEDEAKRRVTSVEEIWQRKAVLVDDFIARGD